MSERIQMSTDITLEDLLITLGRYETLYKRPKITSEYYNRKDNFGPHIFDHFFLKLGYKVDKYKNEQDFFIELKKAVINCHTDYCRIVSTNKLKVSDGTRDYKITNFYNVIYFETFITKLFKYFQDVFLQGDDLIISTLVQRKFFCYSNQVDLFDSTQRRYYYTSGWLDFEKRKQSFLKNNLYYIDLDIEGFYDNIDHKSLINLLRIFFNRYSNFIDVEEFLFCFNEVLFKVNGYNKKGIPQGLIGSDLLSTAYIWLILIENRNRLGVSMKEGDISLNTMNLIHYSDDFIFFGNDKNKLLSFSHGIKSLFGEYGLNVRPKNSEGIPILSSTKSKFSIDVDKIKAGDINEITDMIEICLEELKKDFKDIDAEILKRYFKWIKKIKLLSLVDQKKFRIRFRDIIFTNRIIKDNYINAKKFFLLQIISINNFLFLINVLLLNNEIKEKNIIDFYKDFGYLLANGSRIILMKRIVNLVPFSFLYNNLKNAWFDSEVGVFIETDALLKKELIRQQLDGLNNLLYNQDMNGFNENILGIKLSSLFGLNRLDTGELGRYILSIKDIELKKYLTEEARRINLVLDNLILLKNIHPHFYLQDASFNADLYSLFNIVISFWLSIKEGRKQKVDIKGGGLVNLGQISINGNKKPKYLDEIDQKASATKYTLFYITKKRAELNHKERYTDGWGSHLNVFTRYKQNEHFAYSLKEALDIYFSLIHNEINVIN